MGRAATPQDTVATDASTEAPEAGGTREADGAPDAETVGADVPDEDRGEDASVQDEPTEDGPIEDGPTEDGPTGDEPPETVVGDDDRARRDLRWTRVLLVVLVLALIAVATLVWRVRSADEATADRARAQEVARVVAEQMVTLTADNGRAHVDVMLGLATDPFRQQLTGLAAAFEEILRQGQVAADGRVDTTGVESIGNGEATVLATATTTVRNTQIPDGAPRNYRLVVGLREIDGQWLVSSVDVAR